MSHLGPLVSSLVDGHLSPAKAERARAHLVHCAGCRAQVQAERSFREAARTAGHVHASADLTRRLLALSRSGGAGCARGGPGDGGASVRSVRGARLRVLSGALASVGVFAVALFVLGGQYREVNDLTALVADDKGAAPAMHTIPTVAAAIQPAGSEALSATVLDWMTSTGWAAPQELPAGLAVQHIGVAEDLEAGGQLLHIDLTGSAGTVRVMEQQGVLDAAMTAPLEPVLVGGHEVYQVADHWWVAQCGDSVVAVTSGDDPGAAHQLIAQMPRGAETGVTDRMAQGLSVLLGAG